MGQMSNDVIEEVSDVDFVEVREDINHGVQEAAEENIDIGEGINDILEDIVNVEVSGGGQEMNDLAAGLRDGVSQLIDGVKGEIDGAVDLNLTDVGNQIDEFAREMADVSMTDFAG